MIDFDSENWWMSLGKCRGKTDLFFPPRGTATVKEARAVCNSCPVQHQCFEYAIETNQRHGVWAGLTERELRRTKVRINKEKRARGEIVKADLYTKREYRVS